MNARAETIDALLRETSELAAAFERDEIDSATLEARIDARQALVAAIDESVGPLTEDERATLRTVAELDQRITQRCEERQRELARALLEHRRPARTLDRAPQILSHNA